MKMTRIAIAIASSAMISTPVLATNGDVLIGLGAQSRAMGGTGTAAFMGSENALTNPGLLGKSESTEFTIGGTAFMPSVKATTDVASGGQMPATSDTSQADMNIIPEVSLSTRLNKNLTFGLGIFGSAGMGVDYRKDPSDPTSDNQGLFQAQSNLQIMKFAPTLTYNSSRFGVGIAPVIQYGALDMNYTVASASGGPGSGPNDQVSTVGSGMSQDLGFGYNIGGYFDIMKNLTIGLAYQSAIDMEHEEQITTAADGFGLGSAGTGKITSDHLEQPAEIKIGVAYEFSNFTVTGDYKQIAWGSAKGYKEFNWKDQNVYALGVKYTGSKFWLGAGYNYAEDPIEILDESKTAAEGGYENQAINLFNNHFFPGVVEQHFTFGGGYSITKNLAIDAAITYAPTVSKTVKTGAVSGELCSTICKCSQHGRSRTSSANASRRFISQS